MTKEEDFFKENFPEYVTEKGEFLSPYWDLFSAGVICATFGLKVKIEQLKEAKRIIGKLCGAVRTLNNPNTQLADVDDFLVEAEKFIKECELCI